MPNIPFTISIVSLTGFGLLLAGCVNSRPAHFYTIEPPATAVIAPKADGLVLLVGNIATPVALQDGRIHYRMGSNEAGSYEYHRWTERPGVMVRNSLLEALRKSGRYQRVLESSSSATGDYLVRGNLYEFDEVDGETIQTRISLHLELIDVKANHNVWDRVLDRDEPVNSKNVKAVVAALDRNLQQVINEAASGIDGFLASRHTAAAL
jgi:ABC-type uncharacterized transport system auxiliary subunit